MRYISHPSSIELTLAETCRSKRGDGGDGSDADTWAEAEVEWRIDTSCSRGASNCSTGMLKGHGDGTVPLMSLGYMCARGWRDFRHWNPSGVKTRVREYAHMPASWDFRGGDSSGDHVDIMGNRDMISDVLRIAAGEKLGDVFLSNILDMSLHVILPSAIV